MMKKYKMWNEQKQSEKTCEGRAHKMINDRRKEMEEGKASMEKMLFEKAGVFN